MLARWSSWGALPDVFDDDKANWATEREELRSLLTEQQYAEARRTTINAHYTDPAYVREVWSALEQLGFYGGTVLEPGAGAGTFIGLAPESARMIGVELDSTTAAIAAAIYPHAEIRAESFADTRIPDDYFDAAVGNVPFAAVALHDPAHNAGGHSIHNHFIIKSLALTRPGGLVAVLTSHYTLDQQNPAARREMNQMADLLGAVRLPSGAHRRAAGTEVVTDLLIFRRREPGAAPADVAWETVSAVDVDGTPAKINSYFTWRPAHVLGSMSIGGGMFGQETLHVRGDLEHTPKQLRDVLETITAEAIAAGKTMTPRSAASEAKRAAWVPASPKEWDGSIAVHPGNTFTVVYAGGHQPLEVPRTHARELRALLELRDAATALLEAEANTITDTDDTLAARAALRERYTGYQLTYGPLNRFTLRPTGRVDEETGEPRMARLTPKAIALLRQDPFGPLVMALERFDEETQTSTPAAILNQRVVVQRPPARGAETPAEAIALSLDRTGRIDLELIGHLLGVDAGEARNQLGTLVYDDPATDQAVHAAEYLSGDVRKKLDAAVAAAASDERYQVNVDALRGVQPRTLGSDDIAAKLGAVWIDAATHQQFLQELLADRSVRVENPLPGEWEVRGNRQSIKATSEWGTQRRPATDIAAAVMEQRPLTVYDEYEELGKKSRVLNPLETTAAQEKATALQERFAEWVWEEPERAARLTDEYNRRFNSIALRDYRGAGDYLTLPGMAANFRPLPHQRDAVARAIAEPSAGLFHVVGAGKTAEMVMATMEQVRMGLIRKPAVVVPNHMLEQFGREWLQIYPQARILAASTDDLAGDKRRLFVARAAANDWDAIIMTRTAFERIPLSPDAEREYIDRQVEQLRAALEDAKREDAMSVKRIERAALAMEERQKRLLDKARDPGISFEATGIDYLVVDEMHDFKNLATASKIPDAQIAGSQRASDLHMKLEYLRARHGGRVLIGATATPLANSITEAYVMQRYMRPDILEEAGIGSFDAWAATFGQTVTDMEMAPTGNGNFRLKTRFAKFQNVPEMLRMWHVFADVKTAEDLQLPVPLLRRRADGQRAAETIVLQPTPELETYIDAIGQRAEAIANRSVRPEEDNMLKVSTDGRKASVDMRLVDPHTEPSGVTLLDALADRIINEWKATRDDTYVDVITGEPSPVRGGLQLVFSDLGTPGERWNVYEQLKLELVERGMPATAIRFIHDARNDVEKARLFASARAGHVSVLVGSTQKMGQGTNVQARITAIHHADVPWRPADVEQRDGRGIRQGNQNAEMGIYRYVVERSFAGYMWQTIERKARFISQIMRGRLDVREMEDIGDTALSAAEAKALSSGNPLLLEKANADNDLSRLERLQRAHERNLVNLGHTRTAAAAKIEVNVRDIEQLHAALTRAVDTTGDAFRMTVDGRQYDARSEAAAAVADWTARSGLRYLPNAAHHSLGTLGTIGGFEVEVTPDPGFGVQPFVALSLSGVPRSRVMLSRSEFLEGGIGVIRQLENRAAGIPRVIAELERDNLVLAGEVAEADERLQEPFKHARELEAARVRAASVNAELAEMQALQQRGSAEVEAATAATAIASMGFATPAPAATSAEAGTTVGRPASVDGERSPVAER
ncbi:helicase [Leifsonia sp. H3M29-4]|uniref:helicase n=1 Tax=Salinibacterium metalliresistens TaxID=3031321 RepID=UPI0023D9DD14|nr:helicase [Salinibacterium metalliresistens]MDF1480333.1 helicase [Salinibacterium metalliresistens]